MPNTLVLEGEGPWGLSGVQYCVADVLGESVLLSVNFLRDGHADNQVQLILSLAPAKRLSDSLLKAIKQIQEAQKAQKKNKEPL